MGLHILTAGVDKSWRDVEVGNLSEEERSFFLLASPMTSEGFLHWVVGIRVLTFNVETETFTFNTLMAPAPSVTGFNKLIVLSTGRNLAAFLGTQEFLWETREMERESGEWRKMVGLDVDLRPLKSRLQHQQHFASGDGVDIRVIGWVKYAEVLAFGYGHGSQTWIICYNLDTREIVTVKLPQLNAYFRTFPHRNSPVWLS